MDTLFNQSNISKWQSWSLAAALALALTACGGGGSSSSTSASTSTEDQVINLFNQVDSGTLDEDSLISQLTSLGLS